MKRPRAANTAHSILNRHPVHPFPARMAPGIACDVIAQAKSPIRILDPMMGSGTVLALARANGHYAVGVDIDPLSVLISRVWTRTVDVEDARLNADHVLRSARRRAERLTNDDAYPTDANEETRDFVSYWFDANARRQLTALATQISGVESESVRNALWCAFSRLIITKQAGASLAMDLSHSRPHRTFEAAPSEPFSKFDSAVNRVLRNCITTKTRSRGPRPSIRMGDARNLKIDNRSIDLVLTSPPYLNAIDYIRCSKFSLVWMGYQIADLRLVRGTSVGAEVKYDGTAGTDLTEKIINGLRLEPELSSRNRAILARYIHDMDGSIREVARVLKPNGKAVYVVGENTIRGTYIPNSEIMVALAKRTGLSLRERHSRELPANRRYMPPPRKGSDGSSFNNRMRREVVLTFAMS